MYLVKELEQFVKSKAIMFVTSFLEPIKSIDLYMALVQILFLFPKSQINGLL
jgi:hypothetical protein